VNASIATALVVVVSVWSFLHFIPVGAEAVRLRKFNRRALVFLVALCSAFVGALISRAPAAQLALEVAEVFLVIFVPLYLTFAGLFRSRALSSLHRGGRSTV
jgi:hypothetical protein